MYFIQKAIEQNLEAFTRPETWVGLGTVVGVICAVIVASVARVVLRLSNPESLLREQPDFDKGHAELMAHRLGCREWLTYHGFEFVMAFRLDAVSLFVWRQEKLPSRFFTVQRVHGQNTLDFVTEFDDTLLLSLTTCNRKVAFALPRPPGKFIQSVTGYAIEDIWRLHLDAEAFLIQKFGLTARQPSLSIRDSLLNSVRRQAAHVRSLPLWPIRAVYWYLLRRFLMANKTVEEQYS